VTLHTAKKMTWLEKQSYIHGLITKKTTSSFNLMSKLNQISHILMYIFRNLFLVYKHSKLYKNYFTFCFKCFLFWKILEWKKGWNNAESRSHWKFEHKSHTQRKQQQAQSIHGLENGKRPFDRRTIWVCRWYYQSGHNLYPKTFQRIQVDWLISKYFQVEFVKKNKKKSLFF